MRGFIYALLGASVACLLSGCAGLFPSPIAGWRKLGVDSRQQRADEEACNRQAIAAARRREQAGLLYERCMEIKGYELGSD